MSKWWAHIDARNFSDTLDHFSCMLKEFADNGKSTREIFLLCTKLFHDGFEDLYQKWFFQYENEEKDFSIDYANESLKHGINSGNLSEVYDALMIYHYQSVKSKDGPTVKVANELELLEVYSFNLLLPVMNDFAPSDDAIIRNIVNYGLCSTLIEVLQMDRVLPNNIEILEKVADTWITEGFIASWLRDKWDSLQQSTGVDVRTCLSRLFAVYLMDSAYAEACSLNDDPNTKERIILKSKRFSRLYFQPFLETGVQQKYYEEFTSEPIKNLLEEIIRDKSKSTIKAGMHLADYFAEILSSFNAFKDDSKAREEIKTKAIYFSIHSLSLFADSNQLELSSISIIQTIKDLLQEHGIMFPTSLTDEMRRLSLGIGESIRIFTQEELTAISDGKFLGSGAFGKVYHGTMDDGQEVAIKKIIDLDEEKRRQFTNEINILHQIKHPNVVRLIGCCMDTESPILVYEFIAKGSLGDMLEDNKHEIPMDFNTRLAIAIGCAEGLLHLHSLDGECVVHGDVKMDNILLNNEYIAKLADFGLSNLIIGDTTMEVATVIGTNGYLDPVALLTGYISQKSDVFSFGVVLLLLVTRIGIDNTGGMHIGYKFVKDFRQGKDVFGMLDSKLVREVGEEAVLKVVKIASDCLALEPDDRPGMEEVLLRLKDINRFKLMGAIKNCFCCHI